MEPISEPLVQEMGRSIQKIFFQIFVSVQHDLSPPIPFHSVNSTKSSDTLTFWYFCQRDYC